MPGSDSSSESESSDAPKRREKSPAFSPRKQRRTSPPRHAPSIPRNGIPRPRFSSLLSENELALQQQEMHRRNLLPPLRGPDPGLPIPMTMLIEQKLALQHLEIQRLLNDNQQLAATHISLRQELGALQDQLQLRLKLSLTETEKDEQIRTLVERVSKQEVDLRAMASLKDDLEKLLAQRHELSLKAQADALQLATLKSQIDGLQKELQHVRGAFEQERTASADHLAHRQAMERSYHSVLEEVGRLRIELANSDRKWQGVPTGPPATAVYGGQSFVDAGNSMQQPWGYQAQQTTPGQPYHMENNYTAAPLSNGQNGSQYQLSQMPHGSTMGKEWSMHVASNGQYFYYNTVTGVTQWEKPAEMAFDDQYHTKVQMQPVQQENSQHSMQFPTSQQPASEPNQALLSAQPRTQAHYPQASGQTVNYADQVPAQSASKS